MTTTPTTLTLSLHMNPLQKCRNNQNFHRKKSSPVPMIKFFRPLLASCILYQFPAITVQVKVSVKPYSKKLFVLQFIQIIPSQNSKEEKKKKTVVLYDDTEKYPFPTNSDNNNISTRRNNSKPSNVIYLKKTTSKFQQIHILQTSKIYTHEHIIQKQTSKTSIHIVSKTSLYFQHTYYKFFCFVLQPL